MNAPTFLLPSTEYARRCVCVCAIRGKRENSFANKTGGIVLFACGYAADRLGSVSRNDVGVCASRRPRGRRSSDGGNGG